jgi:hypothetical protein
MSAYLYLWLNLPKSPNVFSQGYSATTLANGMLFRFHRFRWANLPGERPVGMLFAFRPLHTYVRKHFSQLLQACQVAAGQQIVNVGQGRCHAARHCTGLALDFAPMSGLSHMSR